MKKDIWFRPRNMFGTLDESMAKKFTVSSLEELAEKNNTEVGKLSVSPYGFDERIGWDTHLVSEMTENGSFVIGYLSGPLQGDEHE